MLTYSLEKIQKKVCLLYTFSYDMPELANGQYFFTKNYD